MILLSAREFDQKSTSGMNSLERIFKNKVLTAGPIFSLTNPKAAQLYCKRFRKIKNGALCILVREENFFRIWSEDKEQTNNSKTNTITPKEQETSPSSLPVEEEFIATCRQKLANEIGPIAQMICKKTLAKNPQLTRLEFVKILAKKISDPELAEKFKQELLE